MKLRDSYSNIILKYVALFLTYLFAESPLMMEVKMDQMAPWEREEAPIKISQRWWKESLFLAQLRKEKFKIFCIEDIWMLWKRVEKHQSPLIWVVPFKKVLGFRSAKNKQSFRLKDLIPGMISMHWMNRLSSGDLKFRWEWNF